MIFSMELEAHLLGALIKYPKSLFEISSIINEEDFYSEDSCVNKTIFIVLKQLIENGDQVDEVVLSQRIKSIGISFEDNIDVYDYVKALSLRRISESSVIEIAQDLKKFSLRRGIFESSKEIASKMKSMSINVDLEDIVGEADKLYNNKIDVMALKKDVPVNIYDEMQHFVEDRADNPVTEFGPTGPHERANEMYGSLLRPGNITVVVARSGVGKTQFCMDFCTKVSAKHDIPVLHFDNGEMSKEELIIRQCAALSGVNMHLIETGKWRTSGKEVVEKVLSVWKRIKNLKFYYYNVAGMDVDSMINVLKRFYFSKVGRGNNMIFSFDYIKTTSEKNSKNTAHWQLIGDMVTKFKNLIQKEVLGEDGPVISMITSVQSNRYGITNNRTADNIVDDESIVSLSDQITQFSSHLFVLRKKTMDEIQSEPERFGTHKLICLKYRHLGENPLRAIDPVEFEDGSRKNNYLHLRIQNFNVEEMGDLVDMVEYQNLQGQFGPEVDQVDDLAPAL